DLHASVPDLRSAVQAEHALQTLQQKPLPAAQTGQRKPVLSTFPKILWARFVRSSTRFGRTFLSCRSQRQAPTRLIDAVAVASSSAAPQPPIGHGPCRADRRCRPPARRSEPSAQARRSPLPAGRPSPLST